MKCPNCGKEAEAGTLFCTGCGGRLDKLDDFADAGSQSVTADAAEAVGNDAVNDKDAPYRPNGLSEAVEIQTGESVGNAHDVPVYAPNSGIQRPGYVNTAAMQSKPKPAQTTDTPERKSKKHRSAPVKSLSTWGFVWRMFVFMIPVVNIIAMFVFGFAEGINQNSRSFARACLIYLLIGAIMLIASAVLVLLFTQNVTDWIKGFLTSLQMLFA